MAAQILRMIRTHAFRKLVIWLSLAEKDVGSSPSITAGTAVPTAAENAASVYLHTTSGRPYFRGATGGWREDGVRRALVTVTAAQLLALRATPITLVAAPGAGFFLEFVSALLRLNFVAAHDAPTNAGDDLGIRYTGAAGQIVASQEATGFLDAAANALRLLKGGAAPVATVTDVVPVDNAALVLHNVGAAEFPGAGTSTMTVEVFYRVRASAPS